MKYRNGVHFVWCSEIYDPTTAPAGTPAAAIAPTSSPKGIYDNLYDEWDREDQHGPIIKRLKRSFRRLASEWFADRSIDQTQRDEIIALINSRSWKIWRPVLYIIPKQPIVTADRLIEVPRPGRAAYGPEYQIRDLLHTEFDIIER